MIVLLVVLADEVKLDDLFADRIRKIVRSMCSPRHVTHRIAAVAQLPRTRSGKLAELAVADVVNGREVRNDDYLVSLNEQWVIRDSSHGEVGRCDFAVRQEESRHERYQE